MSATEQRQDPKVPLATPRFKGRGERLVRASDHLWRVQTPQGGLRGHLRVVTDPSGERYRAERLHTATGQFWMVGEFWTADDAVAALRN